MTYDSKELIPLYLNNRLSEREREDFENTLDQCPELKREVKELSEIKDVYREIEREIPAPSSLLYQRILTNIKSKDKLSLRPSPRSHIESLREFLKSLFSSPRLSWGVVAVQFAVILLLVITLVERDRFRTLTSTHSPPKNAIRVNIIFDQDSREEEIRGVLNKAGGVIIRGPSPEGLYLIEIKERKDVEEVLRDLSKTKIVRFAERAY
ncbi:MAG: anti-sigma factor [Thermodesulfobacteriota bacterium]